MRFLGRITMIVLLLANFSASSAQEAAVSKRTWASSAPIEFPCDSCLTTSERTSSRTLLRWFNDPGDLPSEDEEEDTIVTDRPDFTEASSTVGRGVIQLEMGYTYFRDRSAGTTTELHSYPETLFRIGLFADWFELRLFPNWSSGRMTRNGRVLTEVSGVTDMQIGTKIGLTEQVGILPETGIIFQAFVPVGIDEFTSNRFQPGMNYLYSWEVIPDFLDIAGNTQWNRLRDDSGHDYVEVAQSVAAGITLTDRLGHYSEFFAFFPSSAVDPSVGPEYFYDGGFTYLVTPNLQLDIRAGVGLNERANDFFAGSGLSYRY